MMSKRAKTVFVFRCNRCIGVHRLFTCSLRCPLEVHGVTTQTVNGSHDLFSNRLGWILLTQSPFHLVFSVSGQMKCKFCRLLCYCSCTEVKEISSEFRIFPRLEIKILQNSGVLFLVPSGCPSEFTLLCFFYFRKKRKSRVRGHQQASVWGPGPALWGISWTVTVQTHMGRRCSRAETVELQKIVLMDPKVGSLEACFPGGLFTPRPARRALWTQTSTLMWKRGFLVGQMMLLVVWILLPCTITIRPQQWPSSCDFTLHICVLWVF